MTSPNPPEAATEPVSDRYRRLAARFTEIVDAVPAERWASPSPCAGWTARDVVAHVASTERDMLARMPFGTAAASIDVDADPVAAWPAVRGLVQAAVDDPAQAGHVYDGWFGPTTFGETIEHFYCFDLVVHGWDVARAAGLTQLEAIAPDDAAWARSAMASMGDTVRMDGVLGPEQSVDEATASPQDRLLAWAGRRP